MANGCECEAITATRLAPIRISPAVKPGELFATFHTARCFSQSSHRRRVATTVCTRRNTKWSQCGLRRCEGFSPHKTIGSNHGSGPKTNRKRLSPLTSCLGRIRPQTTSPSRSRQPSVAELLDVDREYHEEAHRAVSTVPAKPGSLFCTRRAISATTPRSSQTPRMRTTSGSRAIGSYCFATTAPPNIASP